MNNSYQQLADLVDTLKADGKSVTVTKLPSGINRNRKSSYGVKRAASRRRSGKAQMQYKIHHTSGH